MATQITNSQSANVKPFPAKSNQVEQYVNRQLVRTTWQLRVSDMIASIIGLLAFVLAFFILVAIIDSWIWPLPVSGRVISLVMLLFGMGIICLKTIVPLSWRRINPQYAARMIEDAKPGFKNSLLNFLSLKRKDADVKQAVLSEVARKAARDLQTITVENSVDRSNVIRMGFVLVALATLAIVYSVISPKNPLQSVKRVLAPVTKISKPAVVRISDVEPGDTDVFFGDRLKVTAEIDGRHEPDDVRLYYSTNDGQIVDAWVPMQRGETGYQYVGRLTTGSAGIQQPLTYHVVARDGRSPDFNVNVRTSPAISINSIKITPPKYTRMPERTIEGQGEIQAPEGSRINIAATANLPIKVAYIELLQAQNDSPANDDFKVEEVEMQFEGKSATGYFVAMLNSKRTKPKFSHYRVRFRSVDGFRNERPNVYPIQVIADLGPEVEIVNPKNREITLPVNQPLVVEVRAADLDFEISSVELQIDHQGTRLLDRNLPMNIRGEGGDDGPKDNQRVTARMVIKPDDLNLEPGDRVIMFAKASDNRISPRNSLPDPNVSVTDNYTLIITDPVTNPKRLEPDPQEPDTPPNGDQANQEQQSRASDQNDDTNKKPRADRQDDQQGSASDQPTPDEGTQGQTGDGNSGSAGSESNENNESTQSSDSSSESGSQDSNQQADSQQPGNSGDSNTEESDQQSGNQKQTQSSQQKDGNQKQSPSADNENRTSNASGDGQSNADEANEKAGGSKQSGTQDDSMDSQASSGASQSGDGQQQDGVSGNRQSTDSNDAGQDRDSQADGADGLRDKSLSDGQQEPLRKDAPEGEQFDRLKDLLEKQRENNSDPNNDHASEDTQGNPRDQGQPENGNSRKNTGGDEPNESQVQEKQPGKGQSGNEPSKDGNQRDGQPDGGQSQDGQPDQRQSGRGNTNAQKQPQNDRSGGDRNPSKEGQPADSEGAKTGQDQQNQTGDPSQGSSETDGTEKKNDPQNENSAEPQNGGQPDSQSAGNDSPDGQSSESRQSDNASKQSGSEQQAADGQQSDGLPSQSQDAENRDDNAQPSTDSQSNDGNSGATSEPQSTSDPGKQSPRESGSNSQGIGGSGGSSGVQQEDGSSDPVGDKANLDHARKATDLVLQKLDEQKFEPDPELLDQMNWTKEDLQNFLQRWQEMKQNARTGTPQAKRQYENALLSLGLDPQNDGRTVETPKDKLYGLSQDSAVEQVPAEFVDEFNEFLKSRNRARRK